MNKIAFIGGGSFGTSLGILLANKGNIVKIFDIEKLVVDDININRRNDKYIKDLCIPNNITAYTDMEEAITDIDYLVLAVPSHIIRSVSRSLIGKLNKNIPVISIAKGIEKETNLRLSEVIAQELPQAMQKK